MKPLAIQTRPASWRAVRLAAALPRVALLGTLGVLAAAGLRATLSPATPRPAPVVAAPSYDLRAEAYAQSFVRAYLTWSSSDPTAHDHDLAAYLPSALLDAGSPISPGPPQQRVVWTAALDDTLTAPRVRTVVVEARTDSETFYVSVPVARDARGFMTLDAYPALVGPPATDTARAPADEPDVDDTGLAQVVRRAVTNYVEGQGSDLRADLAAGALVSLPPRPLSVRSVDRVTWAGRDAVAAQVTAVGDDGTEWTLRYVLGVARSDRWYVSSVAGNPAREEGN